MLHTDKPTVKTIIHYINSFLVVLIIILSVVSIFFLQPLSSNSNAYFFAILLSLLYLTFTISIAIPGIFFPETKKILSTKARRNIYLLHIAAFFLDKNKLHNLTALADGKSIKSIRRLWHAPTVFILGIFLLFVEFFTVLLVCNADTMDIRYIIKTFASYAYGKLYIVLFIGWILLFFTASIWFYIDTKEQILVPEDRKAPQKDIVEKIKIKCLNCDNIFDYTRYEGICPVCGKYNQLSDNTFYQENPYKRKKTVSALIRTYGIIVGVICAILLGSLIKYQIDYGNVLNGLSINIPSFKSKSENNNKQEETVVTDFTPEEITALIDQIKTDTGYNNLYHKEQYQYNLKDESGETYHEVVILIALEDSEKVFWYQFYKYITASQKHAAGEIVFILGAESSTLTKSDIIDN